MAAALAAEVEVFLLKRPPMMSQMFFLELVAVLVAALVPVVAVAVPVVAPVAVVLWNKPLIQSRRPFLEDVFAVVAPVAVPVVAVVVPVGPAVMEADSSTQSSSSSEELLDFPLKAFKMSARNPLASSSSRCARSNSLKTSSFWSSADASAAWAQSKNVTTGDDNFMTCHP